MISTRRAAPAEKNRIEPSRPSPGIAPGPIDGSPRPGGRQPFHHWDHRLPTESPRVVNSRIDGRSPSHRSRAPNNTSIGTTTARANASLESPTSWVAERMRSRPARVAARIRFSSVVSTPSTRIRLLPRRWRPTHSDSGTRRKLLRRPRARWIVNGWVMTQSQVARMSTAMRPRPSTTDATSSVTEDSNAAGTTRTRVDASCDARVIRAWLRSSNRSRPSTLARSANRPRWYPTARWQ